MQDIQVFCNTFEFMNKALSKEIMKRTRDKNKQKKLCKTVKLLGLFT